MRIKFGDLALDLGTRQLLHGGREVRVSPKALHLLELLVRERPRLGLVRMTFRILPGARSTKTGRTT